MEDTSNTETEASSRLDGIHTECKPHATNPVQLIECALLMQFVCQVALLYLDLYGRFELSQWSCLGSSVG